MAQKVLIADDQIASRRMFEMVLAREGYDVIAVDSGEKVLDTVKDKRPDLALIDAIMPEIDGYQICETLKNTPAFQQLPIILLAGRSEGFDKEKGLKAVGAENAILSKPAKSMDIIAKVQEFLKADATEAEEETVRSEAALLPETAVVEEPPVVQEEYEFDEDSEEADMVVESEILAEGEEFEEFVEDEVISEEVAGDAGSFSMDESADAAASVQKTPVVEASQTKTPMVEASQTAPQERKIVSSTQFSDEKLDTIADEIAQRLAGKLLPVLAQELAKYVMQFPAVNNVVTTASKELVKKLLPEIQDKL